MNKSIMRACIGALAPMRFVGGAVIVTLVYAVGGPSADAAEPPPFEDSGAMEVSVDCNIENQKKVELKPQERFVDFVFDNCMCGESPIHVRNIVARLIDNFITVANGGEWSAGFVGGRSELMRDKRTITETTRLRIKMDVPIGETRRGVAFCYPRSLIHEIYEWGESIQPPAAK